MSGSTLSTQALPERIRLMSKRFTDTDKWDDKWFRGLGPASKLLFIFIIDRCNLGGYYEIDEADIAFRTGLPEDKILGAIQGLDRGLIRKGDWVWVKKFLYHQKNLPLNPENNAHKHIIQCIADKLSIFPEIPKTLGAKKGLFSPIGKGTGRGNDNGNSKGRLSEAQKKRVKIDENTPLMIRIGAWFGRSDGTLWSQYEAEALSEMGDIIPDEITAMEAYYTARIKTKEDIRRKNIETLLNNWPGELDRATGYKKQSSRPRENVT